MLRNWLMDHILNSDIRMAPFVEGYKEGDLGKDGVWDNWRLEGPSFVWYFRGKPHVHGWVNVADRPNIKADAPICRSA